jgi:hypothetical protein
MLPDNKTGAYGSRKTPREIIAQAFSEAGIPKDRPGKASGNHPI